MKLDEATWQEVEAYLQTTPGLIIPTGSTEQHGPMGMIGTDTHCAEQIALKAADLEGAFVAPAIGYTPAPFNMGFAGTISVSENTFAALLNDVLQSVRAHGFEVVYFLNGHGANVEPLNKVVAGYDDVTIRIRSWWDFDAVNELRKAYYGDWEGMHATPSEIAITQATHRVIAVGGAASPPEKLSADYIRNHSGDRHGPPDAHRAQFPDGRVGSHSALASVEHGEKLLQAAALAVSEDYRDLLQTWPKR